MPSEPMREDDEMDWYDRLQAKALARFPIGQEVTVRLNGECRKGVLHGEQEDGVRGTVIATDSTFRGASHAIVVCFHYPLPVQGSFGYYTPGELEPFDVQAEIERLKAEYAARDQRDAGRGE